MPINRIVALAVFASALVAFAVSFFMFDQMMRIVLRVFAFVDLVMGMVFWVKMPGGKRGGE